MKDYYQILGLDRGADPDKIKIAYRALAKKWHPDVNPDNQEEAEEKFKEISEAYSVLSDPDKKSNYDSTGSPEGNPFAGGFRTTGTPFDIFSNRSPFGERQAGPRPMRGQGVQLTLVLSLKEALLGTDRPLEFNVTSSCSDCGGRGGKEFSLCPNCNGSGFIQRQPQPGMMIQTACSKCGGRGQSIKTPCDVCGGRCIVQDARKLNLVIPPGVKHGNTMRIAGKGGAGFNGGPPGDVMITLNVEYPDLSQLNDDERNQLETLLSK